MGKLVMTEDAAIRSVMRNGGTLRDRRYQKRKSRVPVGEFTEETERVERKKKPLKIPAVRELTDLAFQRFSGAGRDRSRGDLQGREIQTIIDVHNGILKVSEELDTRLTPPDHIALTEYLDLISRNRKFVDSLMDLTAIMRMCRFQTWSPAPLKRSKIKTSRTNRPSSSTTS